MGLAKRKFSFGSARRAYISDDAKDLRVAGEIEPGIFVELNLSAGTIIKFLNILFEEFNENKNLFIFSIVAE